jgi:hypothetical protein
MREKMDSPAKRPGYPCEVLLLLRLRGLAGLLVALLATLSRILLLLTLLLVIALLRIGLVLLRRGV